MSKRRILVTGAAGFIGFHVAKQLQAQGDTVIGVDNFNDYYDQNLKRKRAEILQTESIEVLEQDLVQPNIVYNILKRESITHVIHLAAQAGVRFSITHPQAYIQNNIQGFLEVLEAVRKYPDIRLVYASSSSVYGYNKKIPFSIRDSTDSPANFYGVSKKTNELMAASYHHLYNISLVGLRFFTVYGPWGRPDMAYFHFTKCIRQGLPIAVHNFGKMKRDFTYIDDIVSGVIAALSLQGGNYLFNLGNERPEPLMHLIELIESALGKKAIIDYLPIQPGEIEETFADITESKNILNYQPKTTLAEGMKHFLEWYHHF